MADTPASNTEEMVPSISEAKDTIEEQPQNEKKEKVDETTTISEKGTNTTTESSKKKKKKKKDTSGTSPKDESQKPEGSNEKENGATKKEETSEKDGSHESKNSTTEGSSGKGKNAVQNHPSSGPVVSASKRTRPSYKYDPEKITLRFLFANRDGLTVTVECKPNDTVGELKGQLLSVWPEGKPFPIPNRSFNPR